MFTKNTIRTSIAAMAVTASAVAYAQDAPKPAESPFKFSGQAYTYGVMFNNTLKDNSSSYGGVRVRPYFSYTTENVEVAAKFEIDQVFGGGTTNAADVGNDEKTVEVKAAYLKFKVPAVEGLSLKGGADEFKSVGGFVCGTELGHGLVNYKNDMFDVTLLAGKVWEPTIVDIKGDATTEKDDITFYAADATLKLGDIKVRPALYVTQFGKNQVAATSKYAMVGTTAYIPSLGVSAKFGDIALDVNGSYGSAKEDETGVSYSGYAVDVNPSFKLNDTMKVSAFFTMISGDKTATVDKNESFKSFMLKSDGFGRMYLLERKMTFDNVDAGITFAEVRGTSEGYMLAGGAFEGKFAPVEIKVQGAWGRLNQVANGNEKPLGIEVDAQAAYEVEKNAKIILEGAYLASGKAWENGGVEKQNAYYTGFGLQYKW